MSNTIIYTNYNKYPGTPNNYSFTSGRQLPLLPDVNLYNSFNYTIYAGTANSQKPSTSTTATGYQGYASTGIRNGVSPNSTQYGVAGANIFKIPTDVNWVVDGGPQGNGICQNEKGDWFTEESLGTADGQGLGVKLGKIERTGTVDISLITNATTTPGNVYATSHQAFVDAWPELTISGSYNNAVFCYNVFEYTNDDKGTIYRAKSIFELPERIDNLVTFIPDTREKTTLTFKIKVDWVRYINWGIWDGIFSESYKQTTLDSYNANGFAASGTDYHTITHVVNNTNNYDRILDELLNKRQRSLAEQDARYGQDFPSTDISFVAASPTYDNSSLVKTTISGVTSVTLP